MYDFIKTETGWLVYWGCLPVLAEATHRNAGVPDGTRHGDGKADPRFPVTSETSMSEPSESVSASLSA